MLIFRFDPLLRLRHNCRATLNLATVPIVRTDPFPASNQNFAEIILPQLEKLEIGKGES